MDGRSANSRSITPRLPHSPGDVALERARPKRAGGQRRKLSICSKRRSARSRRPRRRRAAPSSPASFAGLVSATSGEICRSWPSCPSSQSRRRPALRASPSSPRIANAEGLVMTQTVGFQPRTALKKRPASGLTVVCPITSVRDFHSRSRDEGFRHQSHPDVDDRHGSRAAISRRSSSANGWKKSLRKSSSSMNRPAASMSVPGRNITKLLGRLFVAQRMAVLLISSDLPEVMNLSHRLRALSRWPHPP